MINGVSTLAFQMGTLNSLQKGQSDLQKAQNEVASGRYDDVNLQLGGNVSRNLSWRLDLSEVNQYIDISTQANDRANASQAALNSIKDSANTFLSTLAGSRSASNGQTLIKTAASSMMQSFQQAVNTTYAGQYLMGGVNTTTPPLNTYQGGAGQTAFNDAFSTYFGFAPTDDQAANITPADMKTFLTGPFEDLFQDPSWSANFSGASSTNLSVRVDKGQTVTASTNANDPSLKNMMMAMVSVMDAGTGKLNTGAFQAVIDYSLSKTGNAVQGVGEAAAAIGSSQQTILAANTKHTAMKTILQSQIQSTEDVDPTEASMRVNTLLTQVQANYAVTGKLQSLSLLNYLS